jgi:hypothetical protein
MRDARDLAERYRDLAEEFRRLAAGSSSSIEKRDRYLRMAAHYSKVAEAAAEASVPTLGNTDSPSIVPT